MFGISRIILPCILYHVVYPFVQQNPYSQLNINRRNQPVIGHKFLYATTYETSETTITTNASHIKDGWYRSHICSINCYNLGGIVRARDSHNHVEHAPPEADSTITLSLGTCPNFVVVTGESGSGKSMLISTTLSLILGGKKVSASLLPRPPYAAKAEVIMKLSEPHISMAFNKFKQEGIDTGLLSFCDIDKMTTLTLSRDLSIMERSKQGVKSTCKVNGKVVPVRTLRSIASAFIAVIDASVASVALSSQQQRMKIIDIGVSNQYPDLIQRVLLTRKQYREDRRKRELIQKELAQRILPKALVSNDPSQQEMKLDLLKHFVEELDAFENRIHSFRDKVKIAPYGHIYSSTSQNGKKVKTMSSDSLKNFYHAFISASWLDVSDEDKPISVLYTNLIGMRAALKKLDSQITAAQSACDIVSSLSSKNSMSNALESARNFLYEASEQDTLEDTVSRAFEQSHELLNGLENVLQKCRRFFEDDTNGPVATLLSMKTSFGVSVEDIDLLITDWGVLARKHGVTPYLLPSCHRSLRLELDGNVERSILLPQALEAEERSLHNFEGESKQLSDARTKICRELSISISQKLPSLGMEAIFISRLNKGVRKCSDATVGILGVDSVDFLLLNKETLTNDEGATIWDKNEEYQQLLDVVGSSGEKARVLLCIETSIPGSVGACIVDQNPSEFETIQESMTHESVHPLVAILYDEIDAHVGGRALVSMGKMLLEQTRETISSSTYPKKRGQVISITHSPSLAALADRHLVVRKVKQDSTQLSDVIEVSVTCVEGDERTKELARMASGDIAVDEAEIFARALLRDSFKIEEDSGMLL